VRVRRYRSRDNRPKEAAVTVHGRIIAAMYGKQVQRVDRAGLADVRRNLLGDAKGRVLEIGAGTGANMPHYGGDLESLTLTEPEPPMLRRLQRRVDAEATTATVLRAPAEDLPFEDDAFDVAVSTLVLCGVDDQPRALRELRRVLRPAGRLLFVEHVRSDDPAVARRQDRMNRLNRIVAGCDCNRPTLESIRAAGFVVDDVRPWDLPKAPAFVRSAIVGSASAPPVSPARDPMLFVHDSI
jgi:SAM-dependent methyltransferase